MNERTAALQQPAKTLERHRQQLAEWQDSVRWSERRPIALVDGRKAGVTLKGCPVRHIVLDAGANEPMVHERVIAQLKTPIVADGKIILAVTGETTVMPRTENELTVSFHTGQPDSEARAADRFVVMKGDNLPDLLLDNETMAQLGLRIDPVKWVATYVSRPYEEGAPTVTIPLSRPSKALLSAVSQLSAPMPVSFVDDDDDVEGDENEQEICSLLGSNSCFTAVSQGSGLPRTVPHVANSRYEVGGGEGHGRSSPYFFCFNKGETAHGLGRQERQSSWRSHRRIFTGLGGGVRCLPVPIPRRHAV